jgi:hypothetical protein
MLGSARERLLGETSGLGNPMGVPVKAFDIDELARVVPGLCSVAESFERLD